MDEEIGYKRTSCTARQMNKNLIFGEQKRKMHTSEGIGAAIPKFIKNAITRLVIDRTI